MFLRVEPLYFTNSIFPVIEITYSRITYSVMLCKLWCPCKFMANGLYFFLFLIRLSLSLISCKTHAHALFTAIYESNLVQIY